MNNGNKGIRNNPPGGSPSSPPPLPPYIPSSFDIVVEYAYNLAEDNNLNMEVVMEKAKRFYNHYNNNGWTNDKGTLIDDWKAVLKFWIEKDYSGKGKKPATSERITIPSEDEYESTLL